MSLNSFFDSIDTDAQFDAWRSNIRHKLFYLRDSIPSKNKLEIHYINETIEFLDSIVLSDSLSDKGDKINFIQRLKTCNSYYKKFGKR